MYIDNATSKSSALSINVSLNVEIQLINGTLFLKQIPLMRFLLSPATFAAFLLATFLAAFVCSGLLPSGKIL